VAERLQAVQTADADVSGHFGPVTAHLFSSHLSVEPGETLQLALVLDIKEGMHLYGPNPGIDFLVPSQVQVLPNGEFTVGKIKTPEPGKKLDPILKQVLETYESRIWYFVPVTFNNDAAEGETTLTVQVKTQACDQDRCLSPRTDEIEMTIKVAVGSPDDSVRHPTIFGSPSSVNQRLSQAKSKGKAQPEGGILGEQASSLGVKTWFNLPPGKDSVDIGDYNGKVVYLYGFQSWCPGCHKYGFPTLTKLIEHYKGNEDVAFIAVQTAFEGFSTNTPQSAKETANRYGLTIPIGHSGSSHERSTVMQRYRTGGTPWTVVVDREGIVRYNDFHIAPSDAAALIDRLLKDKL